MNFAWKWKCPIYQTFALANLCIYFQLKGNESNESIQKAKRNTHAFQSNSSVTMEIDFEPNKMMKYFRFSFHRNIVNENKECWTWFQFFFKSKRLQNICVFFAINSGHWTIEEVFFSINYFCCNTIWNNCHKIAQSKVRMSTNGYSEGKYL